MDAFFREGEILADKYRVERVIRQGGMGVVVAAQHLQLPLKVALKFLLPSASAAPAAVARFLREARAASLIQSEHVVRVTDVGTLQSGMPYMVMELLQGADLGELLETRGPFPCAVAVDCLLQACEAVARAHELGIVHRDLKPSNLFLTQRPNGTPLLKVLDFGISKATTRNDAESSANTTATTAFLGSPAYMSPAWNRMSWCWGPPASSRVKLMRASPRCPPSAHTKKSPPAWRYWAAVSRPVSASRKT